ncbi:MULTISPECIES: VOC family protein [unclassified Marinovum]
MADFQSTVHWTELNTHDVAGAKAYYTAVCGWTWDVMPMEDGEYHVAMAGDKMAAGVFDLAGMPELADMPAHWMTYLEVADVDAAAKTTTEMGGTVMRAPFDVEGVGRFAIVKDPSGAAFGFTKPLSA